METYVTKGREIAENTAANHPGWARVTGAIGSIGKQVAHHNHRGLLQKFLEVCLHSYTTCCPMFCGAGEWPVNGIDAVQSRGASMFECGACEPCRSARKWSQLGEETSTRALFGVRFDEAGCHRAQVCVWSATVRSVLLCYLRVLTPTKK